MANSSDLQIDLLPDMQNDDVVRRVQSWKFFIWQVVRFSIVGVCNATIDFLALNLLLFRLPTHNPDLLLLYNTAAYTLGALNSYVLNKFWTFRHKQAITRGELLRFASVNIVGILCNDFIIWYTAKLFYHLIANPVLWADASKLCAVIGTAIVSYLGMRLWVFSGTSQRSEKKQALPAPIVNYRSQEALPGFNTIPERGQDTGFIEYSPTMEEPTERLPAYRRRGSDLVEIKMDEPTERLPAYCRRGSALVEVKMDSFCTNQSLSVVLPAYNEEEAIAETVRTIVATLTLWVRDFEVIVVNDGSKDNTKAIIEEIAVTDPRVRVISHQTNQGYGAALVSGFRAVTKELAFFTDSDGQFDIHDLEPFFPLIEKYDAVLGYRIQRQDTWMRKLNAWGWKLLVNTFLGLGVRDVDCAFKLYRADFFRRHRLETRGAMINAEILYKLKRSGYIYTQVGVRHLPRRSGQATGARPAVILRALRELFIYAWKWHRDGQKEKLYSIE